MDTRNVLEGRLQDLKERFIRSMPDRIEAIASTLACCSEGDRDTRDSLERQFHSLAGTAGTHRLDGVSAAAFEGEEACVQLSGSPLDRDAFMYLQFLVGQLRGALVADLSGSWPINTDSDAPAFRWTGVSAA